MSQFDHTPPKWEYLSHAHYGYIASDGQCLAEIQGAVNDIYLTPDGKRYLGLENAKRAVEAAWGFDQASA